MKTLRFRESGQLAKELNRHLIQGKKKPKETQAEGRSRGREVYSVKQSERGKLGLERDRGPWERVETIGCKPVQPRIWRGRGRGTRKSSEQIRAGEVQKNASA